MNKWARIFLLVIVVFIVSSVLAAFTLVVLNLFRYTSFGNFILYRVDGFTAYSALWLIYLILVSIAMRIILKKPKVSETTNA